MRSVCKCILALGLVALVATPGMAQRQKGQGRGGFGFGGPQGPTAFLGAEAVQKELKLSEEQVEKVKKVLAGVTEKRGELFADFQNLSQEERQKKIEELTKFTTEEGKKLVEGLNADQKKRLKQIEWQNSGIQAYSDEEVQKALKITDAQKEKIKTIADDLAKETRELRPAGGGGNFQEIAQKMQTLRREASEKTVAVLTDDQKKEWKTLVGEPFEFRPMFGGGFGKKREKKDR